MKSFLSYLSLLFALTLNAVHLHAQTPLPIDGGTSLAGQTSTWADDEPSAAKAEKMSPGNTSINLFSGDSVTTPQTIADELENMPGHPKDEAPLPTNRQTLSSDTLSPVASPAGSLQTMAMLGSEMQTLAAPEPTLANPITWSGGAGTALWATSGNWNPNTTAWTTTSNVLFNDTDSDLNGKAIILGANRSIGSLEVTSMAETFSITGNTLTLNGGNLILSGAANLTISSTVAIAGNDLTVNVGADAGTLTLAGAISGTSRKLTKTGAGTAILGGTNSYTGGTTIEAGLLRLAGSHTGAGNVTINGGTYSLEGLYSGTGTFTVNNTGTLNITGQHTGTGAITIATGGAFDLAGETRAATITLNTGTKINVLGDSTIAGTTTGAGTIDIAGGKTLSLSGSGKTIATAITGEGGIAKTATGTVTLTGANTYTGDTTIEAGTLAMANLSFINNSSSISVNTGGTLQFTGATTIARDIFGGGAIAMGSAALTLDNANTGAAITINPGISGTGTMTKTGAGEVILAGQNASTGATTINAGKLTLAAGSSKMGAFTINAGSELHVAGNATIGGNVSGTGAFNIANGSALTINNSSAVTFAKTIAGEDVSLIKEGAGVLTLNTAHTYTGDTTVRAGTLALSDIGNIANPGLIRLEGGTLSLNVASGTLTRENAFLAGTNGVIAGGLTKTGAGTLVLLADESYSGATTVSAGILEIHGTSQSSSISVSTGATLKLYDVNQLFGGITGTGTVTFMNATDTLTFNTTAADSAQSAALDSAIRHIIKNGDKKLTFSSPLTSVQTITLNEGTFTLSTATIPASFGTITINGGLFQFTNAINDSTCTINLAGGTLESLNGGTISQALSGEGGLKLNKSGGTLTLNGLNTYTGATDVTLGTLVVAKENGIAADSAINVAGTLTLNKSLTTNQAITGSGTVSITNAGDTLTINDNAPAPTSSAIKIGGAGNLVKNGTGTLTLTGTPTYTGATRVEGGLLELASASGTGTNALTTNAIDISADATFRLNKGTGSSNVAQTITGAGNFEKNGSGTIAFTTAKTYAGTTTVTAGTLQLDTENAISADSALNVAGTLTLNKNLATNQGIAGAGTVTLNGTGVALTVNNAGDASDTISAKLTGTGSLAKNGAGKLTLSGANSYSGATNINNGIFELNNTGTLTATSGVNLSAGTEFIIDKSSAFTFAPAITGEGSVSKNGAGTLTFSTAKTYTGDTNINAGILEIGIANAIDADSAITVATGAALSVKNNLATNHAVSGDGTVTLTSGKTLAINIAETGITETMSLSITGSGGIVTKTGDGTLVFDGAKTYTGATNVNGGTLRLNGGSNNSSAYNLAADTRLHITAASTITGSVNGPGGVEIDNTAALIVSNTAAQTINTNITGDGALRREGGTATATLTLSGVNDYKGGTFASGNITVTGDNSAADGGWTQTAATVNINGGTIGLAAGKTYDVQGGTFTLTNGGTIKLNDAPTADIVGGAGTFSLGTGGGGINTNGYDATISRIIAGSGSLAKNGAGTLVLSGANTYTGATNINAGILEIAGGSSRTSGYNIDLGSVLRFSTGTTVSNGFSGGANGIGTVDIAGADTLLTIDRRNSTTTTSIDTATTGTGALKILTRNDWFDASSNNPYRTTTTITAPLGHKGGTTIAGGTSLSQPTSSNRVAVVVQGDQRAADGGWYINPEFRPVYPATNEFLGANVVFDVGSKIAVAAGKKITIGNIDNGVDGTNSTYSSVLYANGTVDNAGDLVLGYYSRIYMSRDAAAENGDPGWNNGTGSPSLWIQRGNMTITNIDTRTDTSTWTGSGLFLKNGATFEYLGDTAIKADIRGKFNPYLDYGAIGSPKPTMSHAVFNQEWERSKLTQATLLLDQGSTLRTKQGIEMANSAFMTVDGATIVLLGDVAHLVSTTGTVKDIFVGKQGLTVDTNGFNTAIDMSFDYIDNGQDSGVSYDPSKPRGGSTGTLAKTGAGTLTLTKNIGTTAIGKLDITNGTLELNNTDGFSGYSYNSRSIAVAQDATLLVSGDTTASVRNVSGGGRILKTGAGTLKLGTATTDTNSHAGGTIVQAGTVEISNHGQLGSGDLHFTGNATLKMTMTTPGAFTKATLIDGGVTATFDTQNKNYTLAARLDGTGTLQKTGTGTLTLDGLTGTAGILASAGNVAIVNTAGHTGTLTIDNSATAFGHDTTYGGGMIVKNGGSLVIGNAPATATLSTLHIDGALTLEGGATLLFNLGNGDGGLYGHLDASTITITGDSSALTLINTGFADTMAGRFDLISGTITETTFSLLVNNTLLAANNQGSTIELGGQKYYLESLGNGLSLVATSTVPEPATIALILGAIMLACVICRRHQR